MERWEITATFFKKIYIAIRDLINKSLFKKVLEIVRKIVN